jgi:hypothetical protein
MDDRFVLHGILRGLCALPLCSLRYIFAFGLVAPLYT